jgi:hypothetical protein
VLAAFWSKGGRPSIQDLSADLAFLSSGIPTSFTILDTSVWLYLSGLWFPGAALLLGALPVLGRMNAERLKTPQATP